MNVSTAAAAAFGPDTAAADVPGAAGISRPFGTRAETALRILLFVSVFLQLNALLWLYTGGAYVLDEATSANARFYSLARQVCIVGGLAWLIGTRQLPHVLKISWPVLFLSLYMLASCFWSDYRENSLRAFTVFSGQLVIAWLALMRADPALVLARMRWVALALLATNLIFLALFPGYALGTRAFDGRFDNAFRGVFQDKNTFGIQHALGFILILCHLPVATRRQAYIDCAALALSFLLAILSQSGTTQAAVVASLALFVMVGGFARIASPGQRLLVMVTLMLIVGLMVLALPLVESVVLSALGRDLTFTGRTEIWDLALSLNNRPMFGWGMVGFWRATGGDAGVLTTAGLWQTTQAHNGFLEAYLQGGLVELAIVAAVLLYLLALALGRVVTDPRNPGTAFALLVTVISLFQNMTESNFPNPQKLTGVAITVAIGLMLDRSRRRTAG